MHDDAHSSLLSTLVSLEQVALARWCRGDPSGYLEISAEEVSYFDPFLNHRIDGRPALGAYYESLRGQVSADRFEILSPSVQQLGNAAVLTFHCVCYPKDRPPVAWNSTEVYRRCQDGYELLHSHWSARAATP
jgi:hypothetical protein